MSSSFCFAVFFFFKQKTAYEMRISDWSSDVCASDLWSIAHRLLTHNQALTLFATHYFEITRLPTEATGAANVHLAAAESAAGIVFLHEVRPGPASRSYGIQVAQRAGIPPAVIRHARRELSRPEATGAAKPQMELFGVHPRSAA